MRYRHVYYRPRPWLDEQLLVAVATSDGGFYPVDISRWEPAMPRAEWHGMSCYAKGADGPHRIVGEWQGCGDAEWPALLKMLVEAR